MAQAAIVLCDGSGSPACWRRRIEMAVGGGGVGAAGGGGLVWQRLLAVRWSVEWHDLSSARWAERGSSWNCPDAGV